MKVISRYRGSQFVSYIWLRKLEKEVGRASNISETRNFAKTCDKNLQS